VKNIYGFSRLLATPSFAHTGVMGKNIEAYQMTTAHWVRSKDDPVENAQSVDITRNFGRHHRLRPHNTDPNFSPFLGQGGNKLVFGGGEQWTSRVKDPDAEAIAAGNFDLKTVAGWPPLGSEHQTASLDEVAVLGCNVPDYFPPNVHTEAWCLDGEQAK
jgi:hypothetical protein